MKYKLLKEFMLYFPDLVKEMNGSEHGYGKEINPFHYENVWTHTLLVYKHAVDSGYSKHVQVAALFHDIAKSDCRVEIHEKKHVRFNGHPNIGYFKSMYFLRLLIKESDAFKDIDIDFVLKLVNMHHFIYNIPKEKRTFKIPDKNMAYFTNDNVTFQELKNLIKCDFNGRFHEHEDDEIDIDQLWSNSTVPEPFKKIDKDKNLYILIGPPGSGKSTWLNTIVYGGTVISRDAILMELANETDYLKAWKKVSQIDVDRVLEQRVQEIKQRKDTNICVDMTNMNRKSRKRWLRTFNDYTKAAIVFDIDFYEIIKRNRERVGKEIPYNVVMGMMKRFELPTIGEFDYIDHIKH